MKNIYWVIFLLVFSNLTGYSQIAFYDAQIIKKNFVTLSEGSFSFKNDQVSVHELSAYLRNYLPDSVRNNSALTEVAVLQQFQDNAFFGEQIRALIGGGMEPNIAGFTASKIGSSIGGLDVTAIADGLARFLIKRGKEELNVAFFQRMKKFLDENIEAKTLFPATSNFLGNIASYRYAELLQSLREAFYKDLKNMIVNLNLLIDLPKYKELLKALPEIRVAVRSAKIVSELSQPGLSLHPANLIHRLAYLNEWNEMDINLENSWKLLDIISESVRATPNQTAVSSGSGDSAIAWVRFGDFHDKLLQDPIALKIYLGLFYSKAKNVSFRIKGTSITVQQFMADHADDIFTISDLVENFLLLANDVEQSVIDLKEKKGALTDDDYSTYIEKAINIIEYGFKVANTIKPGITDDRYVTIARNANNLYKNIYTKSYNAAVMNSYLILNEVLSKSKQAIEDKKQYIDSFLHADIQRYTDRAKLKRDTAAFRMNTRDNAAFLHVDTMANRSQTVERIFKYGNAMASIVKAESPEEAEAAIEAAALPAGSSSIKKNSRFNISLNAYIGGYYSNYTNDIDKIDGSNSKVGVTAPVGIAFSWGLGHFKKGNGSSIGSLSAYLTLIDVGAIAGYRLSNDSTALEQKVTIDDIFAPGGYIVYGIGLPFLEYVPLSIGYGYQYGSKLYYKNSTGTLTVSDKSRWRGNLFVAIDIPLTNFWTRSAKKIQK